MLAGASFNYHGSTCITHTKKDVAMCGQKSNMWSILTANW